MAKNKKADLLSTMAKITNDDSDTTVMSNGSGMLMELHKIANSVGEDYVNSRIKSLTPKGDKSSIYIAELNTGVKFEVDFSGLGYKQKLSLDKGKISISESNSIDITDVVKDITSKDINYINTRLEDSLKEINNLKRTIENQARQIEKYQALMSINTTSIKELIKDLSSLETKYEELKDRI